MFIRSKLSIEKLVIINVQVLEIIIFADCYVVTGHASNRSDSPKRAHAHLAMVVYSSLIQGVFIHRCRDSNIFIHAAALKSLSRMTLHVHAAR